MKTFLIYLCSIGILLGSCDLSAPRTASDGPQRIVGPALPVGDVLLQAFYWDTSPQGGWWSHLNSEVDEWHDAGITGIWLPPISKAGSGSSSMGYDPYDYYDFGQYSQKGGRTRFGNLSELEKLIDKAHSDNIAVIADIVLNHNSGGESEYNPYKGVNTWTSFNPTSGKFPRSSSDFHPNLDHDHDQGVFGDFPDLDLEKSYTKDWLYVRDDSIAKYYRNTLGIDAWRFDFVKGFSSSVVHDWLQAVGGNSWAVGEFWDGNLGLIQDWISESNASAFDFPNFYNMKTAFADGDLRRLDGGALWKQNEFRAVTFVGNHDTERPNDNNDFPNWHTAHAYAYIMMMPGLPMIFYQHYEQEGHKAAIDKMIQIRKNYASGNVNVRYSAAKEYIVEREGYGDKPGVLLYINLGNNSTSRDIPTHWQSGTLVRKLEGALLSDHSVSVITASAEATLNEYHATITVPANGYSIWTIQQK